MAEAVRPKEKHKKSKIKAKNKEKVFKNPPSLVEEDDAIACSRRMTQDVINPVDNSVTSDNYGNKQRVMQVRPGSVQPEDTTANCEKNDETSGLLATSTPVHDSDCIEVGEERATALIVEREECMSDRNSEVHPLTSIELVENTEKNAVSPLLLTDTEHEVKMQQDDKSPAELLADFNESINCAMTLMGRVNDESAGAVNEQVLDNSSNMKENAMSDTAELSSQADVPSQIAYANLQHALKQLALQEDATPLIPSVSCATAPILEHEIDGDLPEYNQQEVCIEDSTVAAVRHRKITSKIATCEQQDIIIHPFTEAQLKALYYNAELERNDFFIQDFVEKYQHMESHEFHELLMGYLRSRTELISSTKAIDDHRQSYAFSHERVWRVVQHTAKAQAKCLDENPVVGTYEYSKAVYDADTAEQLRRILVTLQEKIHETYALHAYASEMSRIQIESYLYRLISESSSVTDIPKNAPVQVYLSSMRPSELSDHVEKIKCCISILFSFQRRPIKDQQFLTDTRMWLTKLVAIILRVASFEDHLFLLNHVLRCPAGISSWAVTYIQIPIPVTQSPYYVGGAFLDHFLTVLATLLLPVRAREEFLRQLHVDASSVSLADREDNFWVLVDSEGEEDEDPSNCWLHWRENDLVAILNQLPFAAVFRHLLGVFRINDIDHYDNRHLTDQEMIKVFSVATHLIYLLREGFRTFNLSRYRQFTKRLSHLIRHIIIYITGHLKEFMALKPNAASITRLRLQAEYDQLFLRAAYSIFSSQRSGAWQFMAAMPYNWVSVEMLWKIIWLLHNDYKDSLEVIEQELPTSSWQMFLSDHQLHLKFEERLSQMPDNEAYYLLTAFANMAISRMAVDHGLIETICREVFEISFLIESTKSVCFKWGRELLGNMAYRHPFIISLLVNEVSCNMQRIGKMSMFLFQGLPTHLWQPTETSVQILNNWLIENSPSSAENQLAQIILSNMNWGCNEADEKLFLDITIHRYFAEAVFNAYQKHIPVIKGGFITESIKQASSVLATSLSPSEVFNKWAWEFIMHLRLHINQIPVYVAQSSNFLPVPDLMQDLSVQNLKWAVKEKHPMAIFIAFSMTNVGHSIADFCQSMEHLNQMVEMHCFEPLLQILCNVTPLFFTCGHYLWTNKIFMAVLQSLMNADITYVKMAKNLVIDSSPGKFLFAISSVIEYQLQMSSKMEWSRATVLQFWLEVLTTFPTWFKSETIQYLLDSILRSTLFEEKETVNSIMMKKFLLKLHEVVNKNELAHQGATGTFTSFVSWMTTGAGIPFTLLQKNIGIKFAWLTYVLLEVETQNEQQIKIWRSVLKELSVNPKATPESAVKKTAGTEEVFPPPVTYLPIYRWAQHALEVKNDHPLLPLFWQKFFTFYLQRLPFQPGGIDRGSVGLKFFEAMNDILFLKKIKKKLEELINYHRKLASTSSPAVALHQGESVSEDDYNEQGMHSPEEWEDQHSKEIFHEKLAGLYRTYLLWLEEPQLHDPSLYLPALFADYDPNRLLLVIQNNQEPWKEFINLNEVLREQQKLMTEWSGRGLTGHKRLRQKHSALDTAPQDVHHLLKRFCTYEDPQTAPNITPFKPVVPDLPPHLFDSGKTALEGLEVYLTVLTDYARVFSQRLSSHTALDCGFMDLLPQLYRNIETEVCLEVCCRKGASTFNLGSDSKCLGPASIVLRFCEKKLISSVETKLEQNRTEWLSLLNEALLGPPSKVCSSAVFIENAISELLKTHRSLFNDKGSVVANSLRDIGLNIFYNLCSLVNSDVELYPPTRQFITSCVEILGHELIRPYGDQCEHILQMILDSPRLVGLLAPHFWPNGTDTRTWIKLYQQVTAIHKRYTVDLHFVILSKFDFSSWLLLAKPKISERTEIVESVRRILFEFGMNPPEELEIITELYRQHLCLVLMNQFPEMYRDVLMLIFEGMDEHTLCVKLWYDILNALIRNEVTSFNSFSNSSTSDDIVLQCTQFADSQDLFSLRQIQETLEILGKRFMDQRISSSENLIYGLYTKHKMYVKPFGIFLGIMGFTYVMTLKKQSPSPDDFNIAIKKFWDILKNAFSAWILPVKRQNKVYFPWISGQEDLGTDIMTIYVNCLQYAVNTIYASSNLLYYALEMYVENFAHLDVKDHVLSVANDVFGNLPWTTFWPDISAIEIMMQILNRGIPDCLAFLGGVFVKISWPAVVCHIGKQENADVLMRSVSCLLHLHICLGLEPNTSKAEEMTRLLEAAHTYSWHIIDASIYDGALRRFLAGCDSKCVLIEENTKQAAVLSLLQTAAEFVPGSDRVHPEVARKRVMFVRACIQLLSDCACNNKNLLLSRMELFKDVMSFLMNQTEAVLLTSPSLEKIFEESVSLVTEIINILNIAVITCLQDIALKAIQDWVKAHPRSRILGACLHAVSRSLASLKHMAVLSEVIIEAYFNLEPDSGIQGCGWAFIHSVLRVPQLTQQALINECVSSGRFLVLNGIAGCLQISCHSSDEEWRVLYQIVEWVEKVKPIEENEHKLLLLWWRILEGVVRLIGSLQTASVAEILRNMATAVSVFGEDKSSQGLLAMFGLGRKSQLSLGFRLIARTLHSFLLNQARNYEFRCSSTMSINEHSGLGLSKQCQMAVSLLEQTKTNKQYADLTDHVQFAIDFVQDTSKMLKDYEVLFSYFAKSLFSDKYCLKVLIIEEHT